ncbi:hypothetical protein [uncultured Gelidibacter sp.]|uniref:hypothetical protein n=1 Tax=uncultured Gelidibacter sp. TaxID=259318 RepID=UPI002629EC08|nr:hypothetical protein [uncultured Gelidibacter sp.]
MEGHQNSKQDKTHFGINGDHFDAKYNDALEDRWLSINADYRKQYTTITDDDVSYRTGEFDMMTQKIARRTNRSRDQVLEEIKNWHL